MLKFQNPNKTKVLPVVIAFSILKAITSSLNLRPHDSPIGTMFEESPGMSDDDIWNSFTAGLSIVFISGIGDKTFLMNMIYSSSNPFLKSLLVSVTVMLFMNSMSLLIGRALPFLLYRGVIDWIAIVLFTFFGVLLLMEGLKEESKNLDTKLENVKTEVDNISKSHSNQGALNSQHEITDNKVIQPLLDGDQDHNDNVKLAAFDNVWQYAGAMMIAECGDKSQIGTIVVAAMHNFYGVFLGTSCAQILLVLLAIFLGKTIAHLLTTKQLSIAGAIMFFSFALAYFLEKIGIFS